MEIVFENENYLLCIKPPELVTESTPKHDGLADLLADRNGGYIGVIHRLDKGVGGIMLFAKNPKTAAKFSVEVQEHRLHKEYRAVLSGIPAERAGKLRDYLYFDRTRNKVYPVKSGRKGVKEAILEYEVLERRTLSDGKEGCLVSVHPITGRTHQIRVQFASRGLPIAGDKKYGDKTEGTKEIQLWCSAITVDGIEYRYEKELKELK